MVFNTDGVVGEGQIRLYTCGSKSVSFWAYNVTHTALFIFNNGVSTHEAWCVVFKGLSETEKKWSVFLLELLASERWVHKISKLEIERQWWLFGRRDGVESHLRKTTWSLVLSNQVTFRLDYHLEFKSVHQISLFPNGVLAQVERP